MSPFSFPESITFLATHIFGTSANNFCGDLQSTGSVRWAGGRSIDGNIGGTFLAELGLLGAILICLSASAARVFLF